MITGNAEIRWELQQWQHGAETSTSDEYTDEQEAREAFDEACRDRSVGRSRLVMLIEIEAATHFKSARK